MRVAERNIGGLVFRDVEVFVVARHLGGAAHDHPVFGTMEVHLKAELLAWLDRDALDRSEEHTSELQSLMRISYAVFCLTKKKNAMVVQQQDITPHSIYKITTTNIPEIRHA